MRDRILALLLRRGLDARVGARQGEIYLNCPFCVRRGTSPDHRQRLGLNVKKNVGHCFNCGWKSRTALRDLQVAVRTSLPTAAEAYTLRETEPEPKTAPAALPESFQLLDGADTDHWARRAWCSLIERGMPPSQIVRHRVGMCLTGPFHHRVVFPIRRKRRLLGITARTFVSATPKWLHSKDFTDAFEVSPASGPVVLAEGVMDALAIARATSYSLGVVALLGTKLSQRKRRSLRGRREAILWLDPDAAGLGPRGLGRLSAQLADLGVRSEWVPPVEGGSDPGDLEDAQILRGLAARRPCSLSSSNAWYASEGWEG